jgi:hypothetical protein
MEASQAQRRPGGAGQFPDGPVAADRVREARLRAGEARQEELAYSAPGHAFKMVPSSLGVDWAGVTADEQGDRQGGRDPQLTVGSSFPYTQFLPAFGQARGVQVDIDGKFIGMRYPLTS